MMESSPSPSQMPSLLPSRRRRTKNTTAVSLLTIAVLLLSRLRWTENVLDLKFFLGVDLPFRLYRSALIHYHGGQLPKRDVEVRWNCDGIDVLPYTAQHPVLFKNCLTRNVTVDDFLLLQNSRQNIFPACKGKNPLRHFEFESYSGETKQIIEVVPCDTTTLGEKIDAFHQHQLPHQQHERDDSDENDDKDRAFLEVHTYMMSKHEARQMEHRIGGLITSPRPLGLAEKMIAATMAVFLQAGRSAVYYLHAHMDHFLSFGTSDEEKKWVLIDPLYSYSFDSVWSGNAQVQLRELEPDVPRLMVTQEKGDILYIPPWWLHETMVKKTTKGIGFNIHFGVKGQLVMEIVNLFRFDPTFFYSKLMLVKGAYNSRGGDE